MAKPLTKAEAVAKANAIKLANPDFPPAKITGKILFSLIKLNISHISFK